jgi:hypothetical protein
MTGRSRSLGSLALLVSLAGGALEVGTCRGGEDSGRPDPEKLAFFERAVRPVLVDHCYGCHSADTKAAGELRVDDFQGLLDGGNGGPAVVPGDPSASLLLQRTEHSDAKRRMPQGGPALEPQQVADLTRWIADGAVWPATEIPTYITHPNPAYPELRAEHWAWQPRTRPSVPTVSDVAWPRSDIDRFVLAALESQDLAPVGDASRTALLRRLSFDLTGLPPTPEEVLAFEADGSATAVESAVDRLLASPRFGEHWGRHWLDVARYGESTGPSRNIPYPHAWRYRDYVVDALNADLPLDRFLTEQIAGDLLPATTAEARNRLAAATGFLALGVKDVNQRFKVRFEMDNVDEQIDVVTRGVMALSVSCARCHDHKFDPIPTADYYALAGIFTSTENASGVRNKMGGGGLDYYNPSNLVILEGDLPPPPAEEVARLEAEVARAKAAWDAIRGTPEGLAKAPNGFPKQRPFRLAYERLQRELSALTDPAARGLAVHGVRDAHPVADTAIRIRGEAERLGPIVPRGFLTAFQVPGAPSTIDPSRSGRLELAQWLTSPANPLTARVLVNRVWSHLFDRGLVATVDNFGTTGDVPSHPELLDALANQLVDEGWSLKRLVRSIVLSRTYQLAATATPAHLAADPANTLLWRHTPRRLSAEEIRDAMLAASGRLNVAPPERSAAASLAMVELRDNGPEARGIHEKAEADTHRSLYLPLLRGLTPHALEPFDPADPTLVTGRREQTTVPSQALFALNSPFVRRQALELSERLLADVSGTDETGRLQRAYRATLGRMPTSDEIERAGGFLAEFEAEARVVPSESESEPIAAPVVVARAETPADTAPPANPDDADQTAVAVVEEVVRADDPRTAAWMALVQALLGSAEFRYLP